MDHPDNLAPGDLVRFMETTSRWYRPRVRSISGDEIELAFFDGTAPIKAPRAKVESLGDFFDRRERVFSVDRAKLTEIFYARKIERLRANQASRNAARVP